MVTSSRLLRASSACCSSAVRCRFFLTSAVCASSASRDPCAAISSRAPFSPMPGTPFTLSTESPIRARTSITCPGRTPNFACTPSVSYQVPGSRGLKTDTPSPTSWKKSLSPVTMATRNPAARACTASVPMTSSASNVLVRQHRHAECRASLVHVRHLARAGRAAWARDSPCSRRRARSGRSVPGRRRRRRRAPAAGPRSAFGASLTKPIDRVRRPPVRCAQSAYRVDTRDTSGSCRR